MAHANRQSETPTPADPPEEAARPHLSIVIPTFNEAGRIGTSLGRIRDYIVRTGRHCEVIVVDDGSDDMTTTVVRSTSLEPLALHLLTNARNRGKGHCVRQGMLKAAGQWRLLCDADLSTPIKEIEKLFAWAEQGCDVIIGSRDLPDSRLDPPQPMGRRIMAGVFRAIRRLILLRRIRDTQCGFKLFRDVAAYEIFTRQTVDGFLFDCEVLGLAKRLGYRIKEVGVLWRNDPDSRVDAFREAWTAVPALLAIRRRIRKTAPLTQPADPSNASSTAG